MKFWIVDVFAVEKYTGNQLAVFADIDALTDAQMQRIAKEMNYSETTFITSSNLHDGGYDVRIFTPEQELPFAGHPTLGTAYVLQQEVIKQNVDKIILNLKVGQIPVTLHYENEVVTELWMQQKTPSFHQEFTADKLAEILNLAADEIDSRFPIQEVSTGIPFIIVPLKTQSALKRSKTNKDKYFELTNNSQAKAILVFCPETYNAENDLSVRVFADAVGVPEDPATGSANGCLAAYLVQHSYFGKQQIDLKVEQGYEIGRPSLLLLKAQLKDEEIEVLVGGRVIAIAKGEFVQTISARPGSLNFSTLGNCMWISIEVWIAEPSEEIGILPETVRAILLPFQVDREGVKIAHLLGLMEGDVYISEGNYALLFELKLRDDVEYLNSAKYQENVYGGFTEEWCRLTFYPRENAVQPEVLRVDTWSSPPYEIQGYAALNPTYPLLMET